MSIHQPESVSIKNPGNWEHNFPERYTAPGFNPYEKYSKNIEPPDRYKLHPLYEEL